MTTTASAKIEKQSTALTVRAEKFEITTAERYEAAGTFLFDVRDLRKQVEDTFEPICKKTYDAHKEAVAQKKKHLDPLAAVEKLIKSKLSTYDREQEAKRQAEQDRLNREAEEKAEKERAREAKKLKGAAKKELLAKPIEYDEVEVESTTPKLTGVTYKDKWGWEITDLSKVPRKFLKIDTVKLNRFATTFKDEAKAAGVKFTKSRTTSVRD